MVCGVGGCGGGGTPGPIPNPVAKPSSADGTAPGRVWESRSPPTLNTEYEGPAIHGGALSVLMPLVTVVGSRASRRAGRGRAGRGRRRGIRATRATMNAVCSFWRVDDRGEEHTSVVCGSRRAPLRRITVFFAELRAHPGFARKRDGTPTRPSCSRRGRQLRVGPKMAPPHSWRGLSRVSEPRPVVVRLEYVSCTREYRGWFRR